MTEPGAPLKRLLDYIASQDTGVRRRTGFSMSTLGVCMAKQLFAIAGYAVSNVRPPRMLLLWRLGTLIEKEVVALLRMSGEVVVGLQKEYDGADPPREGHIDGLILRDGKLYPFDVKSANKDSFAKWMQAAGTSIWKAMKAGWAAFDPRLIPVKSYRPVREVASSYYWQAQGYMEMLRGMEVYRSFLVANMADAPPKLMEAAKDGSIPVATDGFYFFVYSKNDSTLYEEFVPYDEDAISERLAIARKGWETVEGRRRSKKLIGEIRGYREFMPETNVVKGEERVQLPWQCRRCDFIQTCWADRPDLEEVKGEQSGTEDSESEGSGSSSGEGSAS